ncbi:MAG TPA: heparan-alpha-glucosaminide N-acetyltransferase domain-containing protein [Pyrinomonadaceae bacterium]|nr:heparan-alpha-glucosaminide N-acetyltransferase domain-containing protein [Pyrinomonadaceae bacterium]
MTDIKKSKGAGSQTETPLPTQASSASPKPTRGRVDSIDLLRGIVMVIMMLDHTRDFVHYGVLQFDPLDLSKTTTALFLTRWITHFCAPVFVFLAGTGAYLQFARGKSKRELSRFLITRGLWLIVLEFTVVRLGAFFSVDPRFFGLVQVIFVIGVSMIILAALIHLPLKVVAAFGLLMIALHNLLDRFSVQAWQGPQSPVPSWGAKLWMLLHQPGFFPIGPRFPSPIVFMLYPLIPWIGVMAAGYAFGAIYTKDSQQRKRWLLWIGAIATLLFALIRAIDIYGEPLHWARQNNVVFTVLSFVNTTKYPPSLLFLLMTLGPAILLLFWFESSDRLLGAPAANPRSVRSRVREFFVTFGRVPLFFYLLQWPTAHSISLLLHILAGKPWRWLLQTPIGWQYQPGMGFNLVVVYICWIAGVLLLYPLCKWFARLKARRRDWWLSYL